MLKEGKTHLVDVIDGFQQVKDVDLIITSPPYNLQIEYLDHSDDMPYEKYLEWVETWLKQAYKSMRNGGRIVINVPIEGYASKKNGKPSKEFLSTDYALIMSKVGFIKMSYIIWNKQNLKSRTAWGSWMSPSSPVVNSPLEAILVYAKETRKHDGDKSNIDITRDEFLEYTIGIWSLNPAKKSKVGHPAPFPEDLPYRCMKMYSYKNDLVVDPFSGSGTTQRIAKKLSRRFIGFDISSEYVEMANKNE